MKEVHSKMQEIEDLKRKARKRKEKCKYLARENHALKNTVRDIRIGESDLGSGPERHRRNKDQILTSENDSNLSRGHQVVER